MAERGQKRGKEVQRKEIISSFLEGSGPKKYRKGIG